MCHGALGIAMSQFHRLWEPPLPPTSASIASSEITKALALNAGTERERQFIQSAASIFHPSETPYSKRTLRYEGKDAVSLLRQAADEQDSVEKLPVTPGPIVPAREQLRQLLLEQGHPDLAAKEFRTDLASAPGRR